VNRAPVPVGQRDAVEHLSVVEEDGGDGLREEEDGDGYDEVERQEEVKNNYLFNKKRKTFSHELYFPSGS
jgi:hypothetical protein